ncbi:MAG: cation:proton antiporter [Chloroflexi bacterium]|nr:cation:proton antiporter [Chloroflexota bacterium]
MAELGLIVDLVVVAAAALVGGGAARLLRQPTMVGYIVAGIAIGPYTPGPIGDVARVRTLAEVGVVLLMFTIGVELSLTRLAMVRDVAVYGGALQIVLTAAVGAVLGGWLGLPLAAALLFGAIVALSSTVVALRVLADRGQLGALHGRVALGVCLVQDLAVVPLIVVLPALGGPPEQLVGEVALALAKAAAILAIAYWLGGVLVPRVMQAIAAAQSRELFLLATIGLALGTALVASAFGLSLAVGAFLAGLVVSESEVRHRLTGHAARPAVRRAERRGAAGDTGGRGGGEGADHGDHRSRFRLHAARRRRGRPGGGAGRRDVVRRSGPRHAGGAAARRRLRAAAGRGAAEHARDAAALPARAHRRRPAAPRPGAALDTARRRGG